MKKVLLSFIISGTTSLIAIYPGLAQSKTYKPNPKGYLVERYGVSQKQETLINRFSRQRTVAIDSLTALGLSPQIYRHKRDSVTDLYYERVMTVLTPEQQAKFNPEAMKAARAGEVKRLGLSADKEIAMGKLKVEYDKSLKMLEGLPDKEANEKRATIEAGYRQSLRNLLGEEKYSEWLSYKNGATARRFKNQFGFTEEQYEQYKTIAKWQAVQILTIKNTVQSPEERKTRIAEIKQMKIDSLRTVLPREQFGKWFEYYQRKEAERAQK